MLDNIRPYKMIFIQKASPNVGDAFDFAYIYKFYSNRKEMLVNVTDAIHFKKSP